MNKKPTWLLVLLVLLLAPSSAAAAGELTRGFGEAGKVFTPLRFGVPWSRVAVHAALAPDGDVVAAVGNKVAVYTTDGILDPGFGEQGLVHVTLPGGARFQLGDVAVDPQGRIVLIGTAVTRRPGHVSQMDAAVIRYLPEGRRDPSFGKDGVVSGGFGLRPETSAGGASVGATLGSVDEEGRITFVVESGDKEAGCGDRDGTRLRARAVVRLTADGALDRSFGSGGTAPLAPIASVAGLTRSSGGGLVLAGSLARACGSAPRSAAITLDAHGHRLSGFADHGVRTFTGTAAAVTVDPQGRTLVLFKEKRKRGTANVSLTKLVRLLPDGELDPSLSGGWVYYETTGPLYSWSSVLAQPAGGIVLVGTLIKPLPAAKQRGAIRFHRWMMAMPIRPDGFVAEEFGLLGYLAITRLSREDDAAATDALVDSAGDLIMVGAARRPGPAPNTGLALARLELRRLPETPPG
jgi:uncharacterized delta-60 repeat protein